MNDLETVLNNSPTATEAKETAPKPLEPVTDDKPPETPAPEKSIEANATIVTADDLLTGLTDEIATDFSSAPVPIPSPTTTETRKPGRPPGSKNKPKPGAPNFTDVNLAVNAPAPTDYKALAEATFDLSTNVLVGTLGDEWKPREPKERDGVVIALENYYRHKKAQDIPPGLMLAFVVTAYATPRLTQPSTKAKLYAGWLWVKEKTAWLFGKRKQK